MDLNAIAKDADLHQILIMCQLVIAIAVQSDNNRMYIEMIQSLSQISQHALMVSIEEVNNKIIVIKSNIHILFYFNYQKKKTICLYLLPLNLHKFINLNLLYI